MTLGGRENLGAEVVAPGDPTWARLDQDRQLAEAILRKDRKAAAEFVNMYSDPLHAYVRGRLAPRTDLVDDLVQDVFVAALGGLRRYAGQSSLRAWLLGIARHKVEDYYRARLRRMDSLSEAGDDFAVNPVATLEFDRSLDRRKLRKKTGSPKVRVGHFARLTRGGCSSMLVQQSMIIPMSAVAEWKPKARRVITRTLLCSPSTMPLVTPQRI